MNDDRFGKRIGPTLRNQVRLAMAPVFDMEYILWHSVVETLDEQGVDYGAPDIWTSGALKVARADGKIQDLTQGTLYTERKPPQQIG